MWLELLIGFILGVTATILLEWIRSPRITFSINQSQDINVGPLSATVLSLIIKNRDLPKIIHRNIAYQCHGHIDFFTLKGKRIGKREMIARWSTLQQPINTTKEEVIFHVLNSFKDINPGESEPMDIAIRYKGENQCYGWNTEAYLHNLRNKCYELQKGEYIINIEIKSSGIVFKEKFWLINKREFKLENKKYKKIPRIIF